MWDPRPFYPFAKMGQVLVPYYVPWQLHPDRHRTVCVVTVQNP